MAGFKNWREISGERPLNEWRVEAFRALMENQERIAAALRPQGVTSEQLDAALAVSERALPREQDDERDFFLPALALYVGALDGGLEQTATGLAAVFLNATVAIDLPEDQLQSGDS